MSLRYIVAADPLDKDQGKFLQEFVIKKRGTWWHWIGNLWLMKFPDSSGVTSQEIWDVIVGLNPTARVFIEKVGATDWTITDTQMGERRMATWLEKHWMADND